MRKPPHEAMVALGIGGSDPVPVNSAKPDSPPHVAVARIYATYQSVKQMHLRTGGDPAEATFELLVAACLFVHEGRPMRSAADLIANVAPNAETTALEWFADLIADWREGDA